MGILVLLVSKDCDCLTHLAFLTIFTYSGEQHPIFGSPSYGGSYKITVVCLSVSLSVSPSTSSEFFSGMAH